jgi:hypothetical protein
MIILSAGQDIGNDRTEGGEWEGEVGEEDYVG